MKHFYNIPADDPLCQDSYIFSHILEPCKRQIGANSCSGSGYILRRAALPDIGGLPLVDVGEDIILSWLFHSAGWKIAFVEEQVQYGIAPETYASYLKQRMRWVSLCSTQGCRKFTLDLADRAPKTDGTILLSRYFSYYLPWSSAAKSLTSGQKASEMLHILSKISSVLITVSLLVLPISLWQIPNVGSLPPTLEGTQRLLSTIFVVRYLIFNINRYLIFSRVGTSSVRSQSRVRIWSAPCKYLKNPFSSPFNFDSGFLTDTLFFPASHRISNATGLLVWYGCLPLPIHRLSPLQNQRTLGKEKTAPSLAGSKPRPASPHRLCLPRAVCCASSNPASYSRLRFYRLRAITSHRRSIVSRALYLQCLRPGLVHAISPDRAGAR